MDSLRIVLVVAALVCVAVCATSPSPPPPSPPTWNINFKTTAGNFTVQVTREWAPIGADHLFELVNSGFYNENAFFRMVPNFVVQFGISGTPSINKQWTTPIMDDPVVQSNIAGTLAYASAGPNTRTTQLFINLVDNSSLDNSGFAPFGAIVGDGLSTVLDLYFGYGQKPSQQKIMNQGNTYLETQFPNLSYMTIVTASE